MAWRQTEIYADDFIIVRWWHRDNNVCN